MSIINMNFTLTEWRAFFNKPFLNFAEMPIVKIATKVFTIEKNTATNRGRGANPPSFSSRHSDYK